MAAPVIANDLIAAAIGLAASACYWL